MSLTPIKKKKKNPIKRFLPTSTTPRSYNLIIKRKRKKKNYPQFLSKNKNYPFQRYIQKKKKPTSR